MQTAPVTRASDQPCTMTAVNCHWLLNRRPHVTHCFTCLPRTITASVIMWPVTQRNCLSSSVWTVSAAYGMGCNYRWVVRLRGCIAMRRWHFFHYLLCVTIKHTTVCHNNRSLFTITFHYVPNWSKNCTKIAETLLHRSSTGWIGL